MVSSVPDLPLAETLGSIGVIDGFVVFFAMIQPFEDDLSWLNKLGCKGCWIVDEAFYEFCGNIKRHDVRLDVADTGVL